MSPHPEDYFPADYRQARRNFIAACEKAGIDSIARVHPKAKGPDGKPLFIDCAAMGPRDARRALLLIAGTHGVEGYFGSAVLTGLLHQGLAPPAGARIVLVHALNPYGFAWNRRVNEDNVDLDRNFVDHANPPDNPDYAALADAIAYQDASPEGIAAADARLAAFARDHGQTRLEAAIARGQYRFPKGLHFGGTAPSWSHRMLHAILTEDLARVERLAGIDFHTGHLQTGLGEAGTGKRELARPTGALDLALAYWLPKVALTFTALEIGTLAQAGIFDLLRQDNWLHNFAQNQRLALQIGQATRQAFCPEDPAWRRQAFNHARQAVQAALAGL